MADDNKFQHWRLHTDDQQILWLLIDRHNSSVNSLNQEVLHEFDLILDDINQNKHLRAVIIYSTKKGNFIAGADISQFIALETANQAFALLRQGQLVFDKLAQLTIPTVAMIDGSCLGGGTELILACRYRVATLAAHTLLGLPEVLLGIHPGWGGTVRLPILMGAIEAMKLILTGKIISAAEATKLGMIDAAVPQRVLEKAAVYYATAQPPNHQPNKLAALTNYNLARPLLAKIFRAQLQQKITEQHYPAPYAVVRNWQEYGPYHPEAMIQEAKSIGDLIVHPTGRNLVRVFFLKQRLKGLAKGLTFNPRHVHVVGGGTMGAAIAAWCLFSGLNVTLQDHTDALIAKAFKKIADILKKRLKSAQAVTFTLDRLKADKEGLEIGKADVVIEAIIEDLAAKQAVYQAIEPKLKKGALLATNTSSLPLSELSSVLANPHSLVGLHFFNPVDKMQLVEIVRDTNTSKDRVNDALAFVKKINRLPLLVLSKPGFLVNRMLMPYLLESMLLLEEGLIAVSIDKAAQQFGMPMGPIQLADRVGLDVCLSVAEILTTYLGGTIPERLRQLVATGNLGVKSGQGFYKYQQDKVVKLHSKEPTVLAIPEQDIIDRMLFRLLNEGAACLREGVVADADLLDAGIIFGTGFAPFRGGPIHYAKHQGIDNILLRFQQLTQQYGPRFTPDPAWQTIISGTDPKEKNSE